MNQKHLSFDCKRKHMYKNGAPPDELGVLNRFLPVEFHGFISEILGVITLWLLAFGTWYYVFLNKGWVL